MENSKELLLVYRSMENVELSSPVNIMLTPQFYTLKKELLPVKYAYQAKKIASSLFEGLLEKEGSYDFFVLQEEGSWVFIAYDMDKITDFLKQKGFKDGDVSKVFFAQQSVEKFSEPYLINTREALAVLDDTVVLVPRNALGTDVSATLRFDESFTPKKGVSLEGISSSIFTIKQTVMFSLIFILFSLMFFIEGLRYGGESQSTEEELQALYSDYPALQSAYTRDGILDKYRNIDKSERAKREAVKKLSSMIFKGVTLTSLSVNQENVKANISCSSKKIAHRVEKLAKKAQFSVSKTKSKNNLGLEITL